MDIVTFAREQGIPLSTPDDFGSLPAQDPRVDFGATVVRTPRFVVRPRTVEELAGCLVALAADEIPYKLRGAGYSSGGQVLTEGGAVVDLARLAGVVADDPEKNEITVLGGTTWLAVGTELRKTGRRPLVLSDNLQMTVGGTLAAGGVGDATTVHGLAIQSALRLTLVTPDGQLRRVGPGDRLFHFALGGSGVLGAIAEVTLRTVRRPATFVSRTGLWGTLDAYLADAAANSDQRHHEVFMGGMVLRGERPLYVATFGNFGDAPEENDPGLYDLKAAIVQPAQVIDRFETQRQISYSWGAPRPSMQVMVPVTAGREMVETIVRALPGSALGKVVDRVGLILFRRAGQFPVAPLPASGTHVLAILIRAELSEPRVPDEILANLRTLGERAVEEGGRVVMTSIDVEKPELYQRQLGSVFGDLAAAKAELDPKRLCNSGLFPWPWPLQR